MGNFKAIQRTEEFRIMVSTEEKELIWKYAEECGMKPSRLARNIILLEAESKMRKINVIAVKAYRKYLELTDPELLKKLSGAE